MTKLTQEQLRMARDIGATHCFFGGIFRIEHDNTIKIYINNQWGNVTEYNHLLVNEEKYKIDFSPLDNKEDELQKQGMGSSKMNASEVLQRGIDHMKDREKTYDSKGGERSMGKTVAMFNTLYGKTITEEEGWAFMCLLKLVRTSQGAYRSDNYEDLAAYAGLMCESAQELEK